jgi:proteasome lid subunit RPN8/RPN11
MVLPPRKLLCSSPPPRLKICRNALDQLREVACSCSSEVAGFALGRVENGTLKVSVLVYGCNVASNPKIRFTIDPTSTYRAVSLAEAKNYAIVAVFHTHPGGIAFVSPFDIEGMRLWPTVWLIIGCHGYGAWILCNDLNPVEIEVASYSCNVLMPDCSICRS